MKQYILSLLAVCLSVNTTDAQQITIPRIEQMPDIPAPYQMRDWKKVTADYDQFVFDQEKQGTYLPFVRSGSQGQFNYPDNTPFFMDTYVGTKSHGQQAEAINILPAIVGASLNGIDKSNRNNRNWVTGSKDFFNSKNGQNVYLNNFSVKSGNDWWYDVMPNVYFYQLYNLYPGIDADFNKQFISVADRWSAAINQLGGKSHPWAIPNMNYRAFNLETGMPLRTGVPEPESAGSIAWLLYHAYLQTGNRKYIETAQQSLEFLQNWSTNPSYELQLPYGILIAAKMNALEGANYDIQKFINWSFNRGQLRGWGAIVGKWGDYDVSGLIGEANDNGSDHAFIMNGFQHAAALVPMVKYDKRFARAIGKWMLNLSNASRLMYRNGLPQENQEPSSYAWSIANDPNACIPYEAMKQVWNSQSPYIMGDAVRNKWASTDLSLYSGSSVGYMAALICTTNVEKILRLDLNATDFFSRDNHPAYLYYNPFETEKEVTLPLQTGGSYDIYDAITETIIRNHVTDSTTFTIPADSARILIVYSTGKAMQTNGRVKSVEGKVIDYHAGYDFDPLFRIKSLSASQTILGTGESIMLYSLAENIPSGSTVAYSWYSGDQPVPGQQDSSFRWTAPEQSGTYTITVKATAGNLNAQASITFDVKNESETPPVINEITISGTQPLAPSDNTVLQASVSGTEKNLKYHWSADQGVIDDPATASPMWTLPASEGIYTATLTVTNDYGTATLSRNVLVKENNPANPSPLIYYSFNGNANNQIQNAYNGIISGAVPATDAQGIAGNAYRFPTVNDMIYTPNDAVLGFTDQISLCFWVKADNPPGYEQFIVSHGSWEERYKVSLTPEMKLRWTLKTNKAVVDVDDPEPLVPGQFYYFTVIYTGFSMEIYRSGALKAFTKQSGPIGQTSKNITYSKKDNTTKEYALGGTIDEVRIYSSDLPQAVIQALPQTWTPEVITGIDPVSVLNPGIYPNPVKDRITVSIPGDEEIHSIQLIDINGKTVLQTSQPDFLIPGNIHTGIYILSGKTISGKVFQKKLIIHK